ncbi:MAG: 1-acyl-sn-glycerol-3-phosphate acyltransferase [Treponema sp.]|nr:1-acyl-sn-glycerol-3-phosphate acyltransferase [Treponema sp.]
METLNTMFRDYAEQAAMLSKSSTFITDENVYQEGSDEILPFLDKMAQALLLPGSGVDGLENLEELFAKAESGKSCLLLVEHYSNMDLTLFSYLVRKAGGRGNDIAKAVIAIAGMKLNEDNPVVAAFASAYTRLVIYPSRSLQGLDPEKEKAEILRSNAINRAAMKALIDLKNKGRIILIFPSGTRYRPGDPSTKRGVREIDSYIKLFDYACFVAINGEVLHVGQGDMMDDAVSKDIVRLSVGPVISCSEFRSNARSAETDDKKRAVADAIMAELERMHIEGEENRKRFI